MDKAIELAKTSDSTLIILLVVMAIIVVALIPVMKTVANIRANEEVSAYGIMDSNDYYHCLFGNRIFRVLGIFTEKS